MKSEIGVRFGQFCACNPDDLCFSCNGAEPLAQTHQARRFLRHPTDHPITYRIQTEGIQSQVATHDLSAGGLCFRSDDTLPVGGEIEITIHVRGEPFSACGKITWCKRSGDHFEVGVRFHDHDANSALRNVEQVCHIEHYRRQVQRTEGRDLTSQQAAAEWINRFAHQFPEPAYC